jgi:cytosine/adenosine deaminase-related metal-dependent hydrolase
VQTIKRVIFSAGLSRDAPLKREGTGIISGSLFNTRQGAIAMADAITLTARWIFPVNGPPLEGGTIAISDQRIQAVEPHGRRSADLDLGNVAILPGLVNAHTHLDLTGLKGKLHPSSDFVQWLRGVVQYRRGLSPLQAVNDIRAGVAECIRNGTTLIGDIASQGWSWPVLVQARTRAVVFYELLGLTKERAEASESQASQWLAEHAATPTCRPGISPHAPYSVRSSLFEVAFEIAKSHHVALASHLSETLDELELLEHQRGPLLEFLSDLGVWDSEGLIPDVETLLRQNTDFNFLLIHGNYLKSDRLSKLSAKKTVIYCPRTHAAFGHTPHPFREIVAAGGRVALGTDSLASNPDLNVLTEGRFIHSSFGDFPGDQLLRMLTLSGAEALGWETETGSLVAGKSADLIVLPLPDCDVEDVHQLIFESDLAVVKVMWRGSWVDPGTLFQCKRTEATRSQRP